MAVLYTGGPTAERTRLVLIGAAVGAAITLGAAVFAADAATRRVHRQHAPVVVPRDNGEMQRRLGELGFLITRGRQELRELLERLENGETAAPRGAEHPAPENGDAVTQLAYELRKAQVEAWNAVLGVASHQGADRTDQRVDVFVNLARRMQSLSHRAIQGLDELENQVEDPDLLKGLFRVDHLSTRMRRQAESLAVIGGAASRRQWSRPVTVYEVLRSAIAEVEHYNRVKVVPPVEGTLHGSAVADVIHLLAELVENATKFAPPQTQVLVRVENVTSGLAIEVEDRGLGIPPESRRRLNDLLAAPDRVDSGELLQDGRIGLLVVASLARRHGVRIQLQTNLYGGTQAIVVVPRELVGTEAEEPEPQRQPRPAAAEPAPAMAASASVSAPQPAAAPAGPAPGFGQPSGFAQQSDVGQSSGYAQAPGFGSSGGAQPNPMRNNRDAAGARLSAQAPAAATWEERRHTLPARHADPYGGAAESGHGADRRAAPPAGAGQENSGPAPGAGERPPLPRRRPQTNLAPELADAPASPQADEEIEHNPGLMAAFQRGMRGGRDDDAADGTDSAG